MDDRSLILPTLKKHDPLFTTWPITEEAGLGGDEFELGILDKDGSADAEFHRLPVVTENGGNIGKDMEHVECRTPETTNPVARVAYGEAMQQICAAEKYAHKLYCHCVDGWANPFGGSHENYFTRAPRKDWPKLIPLLIARTIITGTGRWVKIDGAPTYEISQRARFIKMDISETTTCNRGVINTRFEPLATVEGWDRMHVIYSEPTKCEPATLMRIGLMSLMLEMLELNALPHIEYDRSKTGQDLLRVNAKMSNWFLEGVTKGPKGAVELLGRYIERARELFWGRDLVTDAVIIISEDTLQKLASNPMQLYGRLDWVTKYEVLRTMREVFPDSVPDEFEWLRNQDMEWHNLDPASGLYYALRQGRQVERIVSDDLILRAMKEPPANTRAYVRGRTQQLLNREGKGRELNADAWENLSVVDAWFNRTAEKPASGKPPMTYFSAPIPNPFDPGRELLEKIRSKIEGGQ